MAEQAAGRLLSQVEDVLESSRSSVVRIRHFINPEIRGKFEKQSYALTVLPRGASLQIGQVGAIHRQDEIEAGEILADDLARSPAAHIQPASARRRHGTLIGWLADMPVTNS